MNVHPALPLAAVALVLGLSACNSTEETEESEATEASATTTEQTPLTRTDTVEVTVTAKVKAVDYATRVMTLEDEGGHQATFVVDPSVRRLNEVMVGDDVRARYRATLLAELRPATADELANPISVVGAGARSPQGATPAAGMAQTMRVVTTVEAVDVPNMRVTLRGPMGDLVVARGRNRENVERLRVGDTIVITYTESLGIALEKIAPR